ncbi:MAG: cation diffusion facilitator family transporter [Victivallales bacterium]|nr:cation diffusion facilitator family transporter [Victivallales bacterium]
MDSRTNSENRNHFLAELEGWLSIFSNIALFVFKIWVGLKSGSVAIIADAWHSLSDSLTSLIMLLGIRASRKPADSEHPFGHGRSELIAALIIAVLLAMVAFEFFWKSAERLYLRQAAEYGGWALWAMIITVVGKEMLAQYAFWIGRRTGMASLSADAWHHRSDAVSSLIILVGIIFGRGSWWLDGALGMIVSLIIMHAAYTVMKAAVGPLLGCAPDAELIGKVSRVCEKYCGPGVSGHHFHLHDYGNHSELTFHIRLDGNMPLEKAHAVTRRIEAELFSEYGITATIHMEPHTDKG